MSRPVVSDTCERLYASMGVMQEGDEATGWCLLKFCAALSHHLGLIADDCVDSDTYPGWSRIVDVDRCPSYGLGFLAQFVGARLQSQLTDAQKRDVIRSAPGQKRGTVEWVEKAAKVWLEGTQTVHVVERLSSAYTFSVSVYSAEVIDLTELQRALVEAKPAGLVMTINVVSGWNVGEFEARYAGYDVAYVETLWDGSTVNIFEREVP